MNARRRPRLHFTPQQGWINDPYGVVWSDDRYHLFFQYNPAATTWRAAVTWGHATSADLVSWQEQPIALVPEPGELGCWSGSVVLSDQGVPTLFYTRVTAEDPALGQIARAVGDPALGRWRRDPPESVITPPAEAEEFRDPYVWRAPDGWRMLVGARLRDGVGAALQYRSADLREWAYDGVLARRPSTETAGAWTGSMWECPQLFPLDGTWVLLLSVLHDHVLHDVAYALGDYDGRRFTPEVWGEFSRGGQMYATTSFVDRAGRRCVMSWLREAGVTPEGSPWAGALSVPWVLRVDGDLLVADPHPNLAGYHGDRAPHLPDGPDAVRTLIVDADIMEMTLTGRSGITTSRRPV
ncbi:MAG TPA: glycoside hydrolase family 32 protein [Actinoplanes sp.]|nr:glycoside hydrolase family 32 protein [Actinoplanes sp.]